MGYKTIQDKRRDLNQKIAVYEKLVAAAKSVSDQSAKIAKAQEQLQKQVEQFYTVINNLAGEMDKIDTKGVQEFEDFRKSLATLHESPMMRPLPTRPIEAAVSKMRKSVDDEHKAWIAKLAANHPAQIKPGMVFVSKLIDNIYEIKAGPFETTNPNLRGDEKIYFDVICYREGKKSEYKLSKADLSPQKGVKFVRT